MGHVQVWYLGIGNGVSVNLWEGKWVGGSFLRNLIHGPLFECEIELSVSHCIQNGRWDFSSLSFSFPPCVNQICGSAPLHEQLETQDDFVFPEFTLNEKFNFQKAMADVQNSIPTLDCSWKWILKTDTLPKIIIFLWVAFHDRLPHKCALFGRHICPSNICAWCNEAPENILLVLRDCYQAKEILQHLRVDYSFFEPPIQF